MVGPASFVRSLDPRLKMVTALLLGPAIWLLPAWVVTGFAGAMAFLVVCLAASQPLGDKMLRGIVIFLLFWIVVKGGMDAISGMPLVAVVREAGILGIRLIGLVAVGLFLALSTSARSLGLAVSWAIRPVVGGERAWKVALSLALVVHFLPLCLSTMTQVQATVSRRCPDFGFFKRMTVIPQAVLRSLGQKTWNQTLAIAGRGLEGSEAWQADFVWHSRDTYVAVIALFISLGLTVLL